LTGKAENNIYTILRSPTLFVSHHSDVWEAFLEFSSPLRLYPPNMRVKNIDFDVLYTRIRAERWNEYVGSTEFFQRDTSVTPSIECTVENLAIDKDQVFRVAVVASNLQEV